ncbi:MAG TPA: response regulator, partial [Cytophagales bacterium]|nr:response regulator [Cytophagales bacterium]
ATNKDLKKECENGTFREDLYHRLSVILIEVPALNKRTEDIPLLIHRFLSVIAKEQGTKPKKISEEAVSYLRSLPWTGNVRELRNVTERLTILGQETISLEDVKKYAR